ncbi:hypothetical protein [Paenibacillus chitinolyticus]|uniref:hypothetical protein n=1 Tax=Paenibacillus chitinolyticus TaxID=79263 RepID=UPI00295F422C|nr:hypothetical protein [Paenibacillus chitinolyticus]
MGLMIRGLFFPAGGISFILNKADLEYSGLKALQRIKKLADKSLHNLTNAAGQGD